MASRSAGRNLLTKRMIAFHSSDAKEALTSWRLELEVPRNDLFRSDKSADFVRSCKPTRTISSHRKSCSDRASIVSLLKSTSYRVCLCRSKNLLKAMVASRSSKFRPNRLRNAHLSRRSLPTPPLNKCNSARGTSAQVEKPRSQCRASMVGKAARK